MPSPCFCSRRPTFSVLWLNSGDQTLTVWTSKMFVLHFRLQTLIFFEISLSVDDKRVSLLGWRDYGEGRRPRRIHYNLISLLLRDNIIALG